MRWLILFLFCTTVHLHARSNRSRLRSLLYRIDKLMSPLKRQARAATTFRAPLNGKCGLSEEVRVCRPKCEPTCGDRNPTCSATCGEAVCMCQRGSVRQSGMCVPISACRFFDFEVETKTNVNKLPAKPPTVRAPLAKSVIQKAVTSETATVLHRPPAIDLSRRRGPIGPVGPTTNRVPPKNVRVPIPPSRSPNRSPPSIVPNRPVNRSPSPTLPKKTPPSGPVPPTTLPPKPRQQRVKRNALLRWRQRLRRSRAI